MKYYKYTTEEEVQKASSDIYNLNTSQPRNQRTTIYSYPRYTNGTNWVLGVNDSIPTGDILIGIEWITQEEAEQQGYVSNNI